MIGTTLRIRYEITGLLSEGPIFTSYASRDRLLARDVTVRIFRSPFDKEKPFIDAVERAVERTRKVQHPGVEAMLNLDEHENLPFLVSELSRGSSLSERIRKLAPFSVPVSIGMVISILEGLEALHAEGVIHGDIGSHNIVIQTDGSARLQLGGLWESYSSSTSAGAAVAPYIVPYLAPEVGAGASPSFASDIYAVGVVLYQLLSARFPFSGETPAAITQKHANEPAPLIRSVVSSAPLVLEEVIKKTLSKNPGERYRDAGDMLSDLRVLQDAIRFGKTLTWPISGRQTVAGKPVEVAPRMSAARKGEPKQRPKTTEKQEWERPPADVPLWLRLLLFLSFFCFAGAVGGFVYFNLNRPKEVLVPNLKNLTQNEADASLVASGLRQGVVTRVPNEQVPRDRVIDQQPHSGDKVKEGGVVGFRVSSGSHFAQVPDLVGHTVDEAHSILEELGLKVDDKVEDGPSSVVERGKIIGQYPEKKAKVERGTRVRVKVSSGVAVKPDAPAAETPPDPDTYVYKLRMPLKGLKDSAIVRIDMTDDYGTRTIFQERQEPGDVVSLNTEGHGKQATFEVYYDEEKMLTQTEKPSKK